MKSFSEDWRDDAVSERAADYLARKRGGLWTDEDQCELDGWLAEATAHYVAWVRVEAIAARAHQLAPLLSHELTRTAPVERRTLPFTRFLLPLFAIAAIALITIWGGPFVAFLLQPPDRLHSTGVGARELLSFADHTEIELNTNTAVRLRLNSVERTVWLEKGEAWFHVAHDASHPFTVIVGNHRIRDLGTEFRVRRQSADAIDVALLNGRATLSVPGGQTTTLEPGDEAEATVRSLSVARKTPQQLTDELAWRRGEVVFRNTPLSDVVQQYNRYNATKLLIADPSVGRETISANTRADDFESVLQMLQDVLHLRVDRWGSTILISRDARKNTHRAAHARRGG